MKPGIKLATALLAVSFAGCLAEDKNPPIKPTISLLGQRPIKSATFGGFDEYQFEIPRESIDRIIRDPLNAVAPIEEPHKYSAFGGVDIEFGDGSKGGFHIFLPVGRIKYGERYYHADLSELRKEFLKRKHELRWPEMEKSPQFTEPSPVERWNLQNPK